MSYLKPMPWGSYATRAATAALLGLILVSGCASLSPPLSDATRATASEEDDFLRIKAIEAHSNGLELLITMSQSPREGSLLEIVRYREQTSEVLSSIELGNEIAESLTEGVAYYDQDVQPGSTSYEVVLTHPSLPGLAVESPRIDIELSAPPDQPTDISAKPLGPDLVELEWLGSSEGLGFAVFRRDVLDETSGPTRLADLTPGEPPRFYDQTVNPGHVYAYRIVAAHVNDALVHFGTPSEEVYVTLPDTSDR